jgi:hypothetical protein
MRPASAARSRSLVGDAAATGGHGSGISTVAMHSATLAPEEPATGQLTHYRTFAMDYRAAA